MCVVPFIMRHSRRKTQWQPGPMESICQQRPASSASERARTCALLWRRRVAHALWQMLHLDAWLWRCVCALRRLLWTAAAAVCVCVFIFALEIVALRVTVCAVCKLVCNDYIVESSMAVRLSGAHSRVCTRVRVCTPHSIIYKHTHTGACARSSSDCIS